MRLQETRKEDGEMLNEDAVLLGSIFEWLSQIRLGTKNVAQLSHESAEKLAEKRVVFWFQISEARYLRQTIECVIPKHMLRKESIEKNVDELCLKDKSQGNPSQKSLQRLQRDFQQAGPLGMLQNKFA
mmetsp:Transcript_2325/g.5013  ORF Transcript_2325/g.5013 Transcript_2325/m.5013 type:complete len:128 (+) Transcript_2325:976-1359(+)